MKKTQPFACDAKTGSCPLPGVLPTAPPVAPAAGPVLHYFTDPICSACYVFEPEFECFLIAHRAAFELCIHMGGLVRDATSFFDPGNGIYGPQDVADHWRKMGRQYNMLLNVSVWQNDPMDSSYPPCIAVKAAQRQSLPKAEVFLRALRGLVFVDGLNIERAENLHKAAREAGLDIPRLDADRSGPALADFMADLQLAHHMGVRGFPTLVYERDGHRKMLGGIADYDAMCRLLQQA